MSESGDKPTISAPRGNWSWGSLAAPRLVAAPSTNTTLSSGSVLRPPQLKTNCNNPFAKKVSDDSLEEDKGSNKKTPCVDTSQGDKKKETSKETVPVFLPLHTSSDSISFAGGTNVPNVPAETVSTNCNFVFGQNLQERIIKSDAEGNCTNNDNHVSHSTSNGTSELLFSSAVQASEAHSLFKKDDSSTSNQNSGTWSWVSESPAPAIPPSGPIFTGEEDEENIIQVNCRLFAFEDGQWKERGRGQLRLNDSDHGSRLVCRSAGSLRVLLNTKVWGEMTVDIAGNKSLRVTATDAQQQVKIFLIMARPDEITRLSKLLQTRVEKAKLKDNSRVEVTDVNTSSSSSQSTENSNQMDSQSDNTSNNSTEEPTKEKDAVEEKLSSDDNHKEKSEELKEEGNPVVIVSHDDDGVLSVKRPLETDDESVQSKKICTQQPSSDVVDSGVVL